MEKIFNTNGGQILISILWGLGLAAVFRKVCKGRNCIVIKAQKPNKIKNKIFKFEKSCYKYYPEAISCEKHKHKKKIQL